MPRPRRTSKSKVPSKKIMMKEIMRCGTDAAYFINKYVKIQHPMKGTIPFHTFEYQDKCLHTFQEKRFVIVNKSRQLGLSTISAAYSLWMAIFQKDKNILIIATKLDIAKNFMRKVQSMIDSLPSWLIMPEVISRSVRDIKFSNGSIIKAIPTSPDAGRSEALSLLVIDECAHVENMEEIWMGLSPTLSTGGSAILISTPNGTNNVFYNLWDQAERGENEFECIELPWEVHPERDEEWYRKEAAIIRAARGERGVMQEFHCVPGNTKIYTEFGFEEISKLQVGNLVLTHQGRYRPITKIWNHTFDSNNEHLYKVSCPGNRRQPLFITDNHPIVSWTKNKTNNLQNESLKASSYSFRSLAELDSWKNEANSTRRLVYGGLFPHINLDDLLLEKNTQIFLSEIQNNHKIITEKKHGFVRYENQNRSKKTKNKIELDFDFGKVVGLFAAVGWSSDKHNILGFGFHINEKNTLSSFLCAKLDELGFTYHVQERHETKCITIQSSNKLLRNLLSHFVSSDYSTEKYYKFENLLKTNEDFIKGIIVGHFEGDGSHKIDKKLCLTSRSPKFLYQMRTLLSCFGIFSRIGNHYDKLAYLEINGLDNFSNERKNINTLLKQKNTHLLLSKKGSRVALQENEFFFGQFKFEPVNNPQEAFGSDESKTLWNLSVEEDESYVADSIVVHNCSFLASGDTFLNSEVMEILEKKCVAPAYTHDKWANLWIWKKTEPGHKYIIGADVSRGDSDDYSAFQIIDIETDEVAAEFQGKITPDDFAIMLNEVGIEYNSALICVENNSFGYTTANELKKLKYPNLYYDRLQKSVYTVMTEDQVEGETPGITMGPKNREIIITKLENTLRNGHVRIYSKRLVNELKSFIWKNNKAQAAKGRNDDLIMSLAIAISLYESAGVTSYSANDLAEGMLEGMSRRGSELDKSNSMWGIKHKEHVPPVMTSRNSFMQRDKNRRQQSLEKSNVQDMNSDFWSQWAWVLKD